MVWKTADYTLTHPVTIGEETVTKITLFEPDVEALEAIEELGIADAKSPTIKQARGLIAAISRLQGDTIKKLHRDDFTAVMELVGPLLAGDETDPAP